MPNENVEIVEKNDDEENEKEKDDDDDNDNETNNNNTNKITKDDQNLLICRLLCKSGARINLKDSNSLTPLHFACRTNNHVIWRDKIAFF